MRELATIYIEIGPVLRRRPERGEKVVSFTDGGGLHITYRGGSDSEVSTAGDGSGCTAPLPGRRIDPPSDYASWSAGLTALFDGAGATPLLAQGERYGVPHNMVGHPLLVLCPRLGHWVEGNTSPVVPTWGARLRRRVGDLFRGGS